MDALKTYAEIDLEALSHNLDVVRRLTKGRPVLAVVKAQAYGHGAVAVSRHLLECGVSRLGVAFAEEAVELREAGIRAPIVVFFERDDIGTLLRYDLTPVVPDFKMAEAVSKEASRQNKSVAVHIKVDTGMGRIGMGIREAVREIRRIASLRNIELEGIMSHFSDADLTDRGFASKQLREFLELVDSLRTEGIGFKLLHMANSAAVLGFPEAHLDMVRPGIMLYGYAPSGVNDTLKPVMSLKSRVVFLKRVPPGTPISYGRTFVTKRQSTIATVPVGYADGYNRRLSNKGRVLIKGRYAPVVGTVCMDLVMIDVTDVPGVSVGDEVVLIGAQGDKRITAYEIADMIGSIPYEVLTSIGHRVKRIYTGFRNRVESR